MALWELNTLEMGDSATCDYCSKVVTGWYDSEDLGKAICIPCLDAGKRDENVICTFCNDNSKSCRACDDGYEGE